MSKNISLINNLIYQIIYEIMSILIPFILSPYISRTLGPECLGIYNYTLTIAQYFTIFALLGIKNFGNRTIAQHRKNQNDLNSTFSNLFMIHLITSSLCMILYAIYCVIDDRFQLYSIIMAMYVFSSVLDISWFYFGIEQFKISIICNLLSKIINLIIILNFVKNPDDLWLYCVSMAASMLFSQALLWIPLKNYVKIVKCDLNIIRSYIKPMTVLFLPTIAISLYKYMDKVMLGILSSPTQVGFYSNSEQVSCVPQAIIAAFGTVMLPKISNLVSLGKKELINKYMNISMRYFMCISIAMAFGIASISNIFSVIFWGNEFLDCGILLSVLSFSVPFISFANIIRTQYLIPYSMDITYTISVLCGAIINLTINWMLIPNYGAIGAAFGTLVSETAVCIFQSLFVLNKIEILKYVKMLSPYLFFGILMYRFVNYIGSYLGIFISTLILQIVIGIAIYIFFISLYFFIVNDYIFFEIINKIRRKYL